MNISEIRAILDRIRRDTSVIDEILDSYVPPKTTVKSGENLQSYLDKGGLIEVEPGASFTAQGFVMKENTILKSQGAFLHGQSLHALEILGSNNIADGFTCSSNNTQAVIKTGQNNSTQNTVEKAPKEISLFNIKIPSYRGKNCFQISSQQTLIENAQVTDHFNPQLVECHGVSVLNSPGDITVRGGEYNGSSIGIFTGGDTMKIPNIRMTKFVIEGLKVNKPLEWNRTRKGMKNLIEFKHAHDVIVKDVIASGSWVDAQSGYGIVLTPRNDGTLKNIVFDNLQLSEVGNGINLMGRNDGLGDLPLTTEIVIKNSHFTIQKATYPGNGWFMFCSHNLGTCDIENCDISNDGGSLVYFETNFTQCERFSIKGCRFKMPPYGISLGSFHTAIATGTIPPWLIVEGNTITGASTRFKTNFPKNTYI